MNPLVLILLLGIGGAFAAKAIGASNTGNNSTIKLLNIDSLKPVGTEIEISATIAIDNPTSGRITIKKPYLKLFYNGKDIGNSLPDNEYVPVNANARTVIKNVNLRLPLTSVPSIALAIFSSKVSEQTVGIEVSTVVNGFPIKDKRDFKIAELLNVLKK